MASSHYSSHASGGATDNTRPRANTANNSHRYKPNPAATEAYYASVVDTGSARLPTQPVPINSLLHRSKSVSHDHYPRNRYEERNLKKEGRLSRSDAKSYRCSHRPQVAGVEYSTPNAPEKTGLYRSDAKSYRTTHRPQISGVDYTDQDTRTEGLTRSDAKVYRNAHRPQVSGMDHFNPDAPENTDLRRVPAFRDRANTRDRPRVHRLNEPFDAPAFVETPYRLSSPVRMPALPPSYSKASRWGLGNYEDQSRSNTPVDMLRAPPRPDSLGITPRYGNIENAKSSASGSTKHAESLKPKRQAPPSKHSAPTVKPKHQEVSKFTEMMDVTLDAPYRRDAPPARPHPVGMPNVVQWPGESDADWNVRYRKEEREWYTRHPYGSLIAMRQNHSMGRFEPTLVPKKYPDPPHKPQRGFLGALGRCVGAERRQKVCMEPAW